MVKPLKALRCEVTNTKGGDYRCIYTCMKRKKERERDSDKEIETDGKSKDTAVDMTHTTFVDEF